MTELTPLFSPREISAIIEDLAGEIRDDYRGKDPVLIGLLKGAYVFIADLTRAIDMDLEVEFIQPSSYRRGTKSAEDVELVHNLKADVMERHVLIIDGIVDRGATLRRVIKEVSALGPASIKVCSLLVREGVEHGVSVDYMGRALTHGFVVGYGMDLGGKYRQLKGLYTVNQVD